MRKETSSNSINQNAFTNGCPITATLLAIGGRWKTILIWQMKDRPLRYNEFKKAIPNISEKMLTQQLKELVQSGWIIKKDYNEIPPRTEYSLTPLGASFIPVLEHMSAWGKENGMG